jgi:hypothetical protein
MDLIRPDEWYRVLPWIKFRKSNAAVRKIGETPFFVDCDPGDGVPLVARQDLILAKDEQFVAIHDAFAQSFNFAAHFFDLRMEGRTIR